MARMTPETFHKAVFRSKGDAPSYLVDAEHLYDNAWTARVNSELLDLMEKDDNVISVEISYYRLDT
jgi:hypothetical protein